MREPEIPSAKRLAAAVLAALLLCAALLSAFCLAAEAHHDCTGKDCPVCALARAAERTLRSGAAAQARPVVLSALLLLLPVLCRDVLLGVTPVSRKVRMNN